MKTIFCIMLLASTTLFAQDLKPGAMLEILSSACSGGKEYRINHDVIRKCYEAGNRKLIDSDFDISPTELIKHVCSIPGAVTFRSGEGIAKCYTISIESLLSYGPLIDPIVKHAYEKCGHTSYGKSAECYRTFLNEN